jgi:hypothetical protein
MPETRRVATAWGVESTRAPRRPLVVATGQELPKTLTTEERLDTMTASLDAMASDLREVKAGVAALHREGAPSR